MRLTIPLIVFLSVASAQTQGPPEAKTQPQTDAKAENPAANAAIAIAEEWRDGDPLPTAGENGAIVYRYGAAMPPIICAPERLTTILLEPGERIQNPPMMGDTLRWEYQMLVAGEGALARTSVVLKPKRVGISTDLVIATNRRWYQFRLESREKKHLSQVEFSYPASANWVEYLAQQVQENKERKENTVAELQGKPNFGYSTKAKQHVPFMPKTIYDDGHHTFLKMAPEAKSWEAPVLQTAGPNGCEIVNYRVEGDTWIIDRLFMSAELVSGTGKKAQRVSIQRDGTGAVTCVKPGKIQTAKK